MKCTCMYAHPRPNHDGHSSKDRIRILCLAVGYLRTFPGYRISDEARAGIGLLFTHRADVRQRINQNRRMAKRGKFRLKIYSRQERNDQRKIKVIRKVVGVCCLYVLSDVNSYLSNPSSEIRIRFTIKQREELLKRKTYFGEKVTREYEKGFIE